MEGWGLISNPYKDFVTWWQNGQPRCGQRLPLAASGATGLPGQAGRWHAVFENVPSLGGRACSWAWDGRRSGPSQLCARLSSEPVCVLLKRM